MASLVYTTEQRGFEYVDGVYVLTGVKVKDMSGNMTSVDNGTVNKNGSYIGNFNVRYENGQPKTSINNMDMDEMLVVAPKVSALLDELNKEN